MNKRISDDALFNLSLTALLALIGVALWGPSAHASWESRQPSYESREGVGSAESTSIDGSSMLPIGIWNL